LGYHSDWGSILVRKREILLDRMVPHYLGALESRRRSLGDPWLDNSFQYLR
jgi:hypothetical protein